MDLGAGTGKSTIPLLDYFAEVIAVEPDPLMAEKLRASAPRAVIRDVSAEDCIQEADSVDLVTAVAALHWMDIPRVMSNIVRWLRPEGLLVVGSGGFPQVPAPVQHVVREQFERHWNRFRDSRLDFSDSPQRTRSEIAELRIVEDTSVTMSYSVTPAIFAGFCRSTSYGSAYARALSDPELYWLDLENRFRQAWPEEKFPIDFNPWLLIARKE
jgi:SAM-dependent methyltransferase